MRFFSRSVLSLAENMTSLGGPMMIANATGIFIANATLYDGPFTDPKSLQQTLTYVWVVFLSTLLGCIIITTVLGNVIVITAILVESHLRTPPNFLIMSLAFADLLVASFVMPLGAVYEVTREWRFSPELCDLWTGSDVLCCTSSILHLVAIALDRYWAVTNVEYIHKRTPRLMSKMIITIWSISFLVSIAPSFGMKDEGWLDRVLQQKICIAAKSRIRKHTGTQGSSSGPNVYARHGGVIAGLVSGCTGQTGIIATAIVGAIGQPLPTITEGTTTNITTMTTGTSGSSGLPTKSMADFETDAPTEATSSTAQAPTQLPKPKKRKNKKGPLDSKRERKAAKTLAIITGVFVGCWMPFFVLALILPLCRKLHCIVPQYVLSFSVWLGYLNSTINPFIYTTFNPEFRNAFRRLFRGQRGPRRGGPPPRYV
ncbi:5-hydroxytryptamine receptor-like isoform X3 [Planococcus citri]|uniref:5-hydroxytryptamine receptor-like isoform X3 n=1 Tax=Planococcus citri TaxID=170843 RepID=UPI0031F7605C